MPYYYLITEVRDVEESNPTVRNIHRFTKKPEAYDLLLPSIHASREDNVLEAHCDADQAVAALIASSSDAPSWPSSSCNTDEIGDADIQDRDVIHATESENHHPDFLNNHVEANSEKILKPPKQPVYAKYKPPFWSYDAVQPEVIDAARSLFFERRRQKAMYDAAPTWHNPAGSPRIPSDYELFAAWASLSRSEKMTFILEVSGGSAASPQPRNNAVETQRAVSALYCCCPDSHSWPSFQFTRSQTPPQSSSAPRTNPLLAKYLPSYNFQ